MLAADVEDHPATRPASCWWPAAGVPAPTGHDKTRMVVFQRADVPGSLLVDPAGVRGPRPSTCEAGDPADQAGGLGDYCFIIDLEGHIADEVVADCLRDLHSKQGDVKFLGSYPAAGEHGPARAARRRGGVAPADEWVAELRGQVGRSPVGRSSPDLRPRRDGRAAECDGLENRWAHGPRGFKSHSLRSENG